MEAEAVTVAEESQEPEPDPEVEPVVAVKEEKDEREDEDEEDAWLKTFPSQFLGWHDGRHYFADPSGHVVSFRAEQLGWAERPGDLRKRALKLAPLSWYRRHFPRGKRQISWQDAAGAIASHCSTTGAYEASRIRGRGFWRNEDGPVIHLGNRLLPPGEGEFIDKPESYSEDGRVYLRRPRLPGPHEKRILELEETGWLLNLFEDLPWEHRASAHLAAGWVVLAPFCGYLGWRPHICLTGDAGCGKTTTMAMAEILVPLTAGMSLHFDGPQTTEAQIRDKMGQDALPVLVDDLGGGSERAMTRLKEIERSVRTASDSFFKAAQEPLEGGLRTWKSRSMYCFASADGGFCDPWDQRISLLRLQHSDTMPDGEWERLRESVQRRIDRLDWEFARKLLARTTVWARSGKLDRLLEVSQAVAMATLPGGKAAHAVDQYGTLLAGALMLQHDGIPTEDDVMAYMKDLGVRQHLESQFANCGGWAILAKLFGQSAQWEHSSYATVGELVDIVIGDRSQSQELRTQEAHKHLRHLGFRVGAESLFVANQSEWIARQLGVENGWYDRLRKLPGAKAAGNPHRFGDHTRRATEIPLSFIRSMRG